MSHFIDWVSPEMTVFPIVNKAPYSDAPPATIGNFISSEDNPIAFHTSGGTGYTGNTGANWNYALVFAAKYPLPRLTLPTGATDVGWAVKGLADMARQPDYQWVDAAAYIDTEAHITAALDAATLVAGQAMNMPGLLHSLTRLGTAIRDDQSWPLGTSAGGEGFGGWGGGSGFGSVADTGKTLLVTCYVAFSRPRGGDVFDPGPFDAGYRPVITASHSYDYTPPPPTAYVTAGGVQHGIV